MPCLKLFLKMFSLSQIVQILRGSKGDFSVTKDDTVFPFFRSYYLLFSCFFFKLCFYDISHCNNRNHKSNAHYIPLSIYLPVRTSVSLSSSSFSSDVKSDFWETNFRLSCIIEDKLNCSMTNHF